MSKYRLVCTKCGKVYGNFGQWFADGAKCSVCDCARAEAEYDADYSRLQNTDPDYKKSFFKYFDFLPVLSKENVITCDEGATPIERWQFLETLAREKYGISCEVHVCRNDLSGGTGTFKDPAGALGASLFKEWGVDSFCVASTGNTATAFARYCALAGVKYTVYVPEDVSPDTVDAIRGYGQNCVICDGNYAYAKKVASETAAREGCLISQGNIDPVRVESKRTLVFELLEHFEGSMPDVYFQAVAGGTCPIAVDKAIRELTSKGIEVKLPKMILTQQDTCDPMVQAWEKARSEGFPEGYEKEYPSLTPKTDISILSTGTPGMYPIVAPIVRRSGGSFVRVKEAEVVDFAAWIHKNTGVVLGPASIVCLMGFEQALREGLVADGQKVLINYGEGAGRNKAFAAKVLDK